MEWNTLLSIVAKALTQTALNDNLLFLIDAHETTIAHRFAVHIERILQQDLPEQRSENPYSIDCEYDAMGDQRKELRRSNDPALYDALWSCRTRKRDRGVVGVCPDIIIHRRRESDLENNLLVVELKTGKTPDDVCDHVKLTAFTRPATFQFQYQYGLYLRLRAGEEFSPERVVEHARRYVNGESEDVTREFTEIIDAILRDIR